MASANILAGFKPETVELLHSFAAYVDEIDGTEATPTELALSLIEADGRPGEFQAEQIVGQRLGGHFKSVQDFLKALPDKVRSEAKAASYTVESRYFLCETISWFGQAQAHYQGLIRRDKGKMPRLLWVERMQGQG